jgi:hypothetical protein
MNIYDLTIKQLRRAVSIKEQIENLTRQLGSMFKTSADSNTAGRKKRRGLSTAARRKIAAAQKARWAKLRHSEPAARSSKHNGKAPKKRMSSAARANLSAKLKAYWASKKKDARR